MRSDVVKKGVAKAPHRALFKASGLTDEEINKPLIGIVTSQNDIIPGHVNLDKVCCTWSRCCNTYSNLT